MYNSKGIGEATTWKNLQHTDFCRAHEKRSIQKKKKKWNKNIYKRNVMGENTGEVLTVGWFLGGVAVMLQQTKL